ncbi:MAG: CooT family nickel-binding protein [Pseudomonadota bacterium]
MCESNAYLVDGTGEESLLMESVDYLRVEDGRILIRSLFGEEMSVPGSLKEMRLTAHKITIQGT